MGGVAIMHSGGAAPTPSASDNQDASADVLRAWVKHAYVLRRAYQHPSLDRTVVRIDTLARVTFAKLVRGRRFLVACSDTMISELSVWEILSPSDCTLRNRVYFPAPVLDGIIDDGESHIRFAVTVGTWCVVSLFIFFFRLTFARSAVPAYVYWNLQRMTMTKSSWSSMQRLSMHLMCFTSRDTHFSLLVYMATIRGQ